MPSYGEEKGKSINRHAEAQPGRKHALAVIEPVRERIG
jgi:hypothetical protein